jgi:hypothetical protein
MKFEQTEMAKDGRFFEQLGRLMRNPETTLDQMMIYCHSHGRVFDFRIVQLATGTATSTSE